MSLVVIGLGKNTNIQQSIDKLQSSGILKERARILEQIEEQIRDTEDNPLYDGKERHLVLSTLRRVRRLVASEKE